MIQNPKWVKIINLCDNGVFKNCISDIKIDQNHRKLSFLLVYIDLYTVLIEMRKFENQYVILMNYQRMSGSKN